MSEKHRVTLPAGTIVHLFGVPARLTVDTEVVSATIAEVGFDDFVDQWGEMGTMRELLGAPHSKPPPIFMPTDNHGREP